MADDEQIETAEEQIRVSKTTKSILDSLKIIPRETYDDVIVRLIKKVKIDD